MTPPLTASRAIEKILSDWEHGAEESRPWSSNRANEEVILRLIAALRIARRPAEGSYLDDAIGEALGGKR